MGAALKYLREFFANRGLTIDNKSLTSLLVLLVTLISLPIGIYLIKQNLTLAPRAAGELIQLGEGGCIKLNKDKKKAVDCPLVPLKLTNPFFDVNTVTVKPSVTASQNSSALPSASVQPSGSAQASASTGTGSPQNVNVVKFNNNIQKALDNIKATGGSVYLPTGTYLITEKIRLYSNTTLFGDGMGASIIKFADNVVVDDMMANDTTSGQSNIVVRDLTLQGPDIPRIVDTGHGLKLENIDKAYVINVEINDVMMDGIYLGYKNKDGGPKGVTNVRVTGCKVNRSQRQQIGLIMGSNVVIDGCNIDGTNKHGQQVYAGIDLEPDDANTPVSNSYIIGNTISNTNIGIALNGANGESKNAATVHDNKVCGNNVNAISIPIADSGQNNQISSNSCEIPGHLATLPPAPAKPAAKRDSFWASLVKTVLAQDSDDIFIDGEDSDSEDKFVNDAAGDSDDDFGDGNSETTISGSDKLLYRLAETQAGLDKAKWKEFALKPSGMHLALNSYGEKTNIFDFLAHGFAAPVFAQDSDDVFIDGEDSDSDDQFLNTAGSNAASSLASPAAVSSGTPTFSVGSQFINTTFKLTDIKPGTKQIWVQFLHPDGTTRVDSMTFNLVDKTPQILGLACNLDISKENLKITIEGEHFGNAVGTIETTAPSKLKPEILGWNDNQAIGFLKKPGIPINEGSRFKIKLIRPDGFESGEAVCAVDKSLVSLGARIFCREPGKFDASDVTVNLIYNPEDPSNPNKLNKVEEKVTINADGEINNLKTKLQVDKNYAIAIRAPHSLRRTAVFTAQEGTTEILRPDGNPFILPIGDIAPPISQDGRINSLDRSELIRQWRILGQSNQSDSKLTGDFNRDSRVNSIDWACMNYDFGAEDEPMPTTVPQPASGSIHIPGEATITIGASTQPISPSSPSPGGSVLPIPSPSKDTSNSAKIDLGGKLFLDTNRNGIADIGESYISQGAAVIRLLQVPEEHQIGIPLTEQELTDSKILTQVTNNLPGASYDLSVFVEKNSGSKFTVSATANSGQLTGGIDFALQTPLENSSQVINIPVTSATQ